MMARTRALRLGLPLALGLLLQPHTAAAHVAVKVMKDTNIGYAHGSGLEPPGTAVAGAPFMIFFGVVPSPAACAAACVADPACTGFVHTDDKQEQKVYDNTCYFRTDGCHDTSCDKAVRKQSHHESGYLYCADDPTQGAGPPGPTKEQLDACGHDEGAGFGALFVVAFGVGSALYVGGGLAYGKRLNVPAGSSVRFEPGDKKTVTLVEIAGNKVRAARGSLEQFNPGLSCS